MKEEKLLQVHGGRFIDPKDCGSTVAWIVEVRGKRREPKPENRKYHEKGYVIIDVDVSLSDCTRRISWDVSGDHRHGPGTGVNLAKIDAAIDELYKLRLAMVAAMQMRDEKLKEFGIVKDEDEEEE